MRLRSVVVLPKGPTQICIRRENLMMLVFSGLLLEN